MQTVLIAVGLILVVALVVFLITKRYSHFNLSDKTSHDRQTNEKVDADTPLESPKLGYFQEITLPNEFNFSGYKKLKHSDLILTTFDQLVPSLATGTSAVTSKLAYDATKGTYQAILEPGKELMKSAKTPGRFRGIAKRAKHPGIAGQAELEKVNEKLPKLATKAAVLENATAVVSMTVGQYYMTEINEKLGEIDKSLESIKNFQNIELLADIRSVIRETRHIATFNEEIIANESERLESRKHVRELEEKTAKLLDQVNGLIKAQLVDVHKFEEYEQSTRDIATAMSAQTSLLATLQELSRLIVVLSNSEISQERAEVTYKELSENSLNVQIELQNWHKKEIEQLHIDLKQARYPKTGIKKIVSQPVKLINQAFAFQEISQKTLEQINSESLPRQTELPETAGYQQPVELLISENQIYYRIPDLKDETTSRPGSGNHFNLSLYSYKILHYYNVLVLLISLFGLY
ncbi:hypothetical protein HU830_07790 [Lactobacillus sp. DCY120]|uniref:Uncharacterized protein n=1 Tax=Bombilactobacillus apium TaxID=2675299 RepID=A0A850REA7_9LACO|nr:hypothetical protein [Bombilactobacillus apium]NVY97048.1 hypothetical protein [Bombilactobacillus apium]